MDVVPSDQFSIVGRKFVNNRNYKAIDLKDLKRRHKIFLFLTFQPCCQVTTSFEKCKCSLFRNSRYELSRHIQSDSDDYETFLELQCNYCRHTAKHHLKYFLPRYSLEKNKTCTIKNIFNDDSVLDDFLCRAADRHNAMMYYFWCQREELRVLFSTYETLNGYFHQNRNLKYVYIKPPLESPSINEIMLKVIESENVTIANYVRKFVPIFDDYILPTIRDNDSLLYKHLYELFMAYCLIPGKIPSLVKHKPSEIFGFNLLRFVMKPFRRYLKENYYVTLDDDNFSKLISFINNYIINCKEKICLNKHYNLCTDDVYDKTSSKQFKLMLMTNGPSLKQDADDSELDEKRESKIFEFIEEDDFELIHNMNASHPIEQHGNSPYKRIKLDDGKEYGGGLGSCESIDDYHTRKVPKVLQQGNFNYNTDQVQDKPKKVVTINSLKTPISSSSCDDYYCSYIDRNSLYLNIYLEDFFLDSDSNIFIKCSCAKEEDYEDPLYNGAPTLNTFDHIFCTNVDPPLRDDISVEKEIKTFILTELENLFKDQLPLMDVYFINKILFDRTTSSLAFANRETGKIIAGITYKYYPSRKTCGIEFMAVKGPAQCKGLGTSLIWMLTKHIPACKLYVVYADERAILFYRKMGFVNIIKNNERRRFTNILGSFDNAKLMKATSSNICRKIASKIHVENIVTIEQIVHSPSTCQIHAKVPQSMTDFADRKSITDFYRQLNKDHDFRLAMLTTKGHIGRTQDIRDTVKPLLSRIFNVFQLGANLPYDDLARIFYYRLLTLIRHNEWKSLDSTPDITKLVYKGEIKLKKVLASKFGIQEIF